MVPPVGYRTFLSLAAECAFLLSDSGGVQEETTVLGVPCFTLRDSTERPVTVTHGTNTIMGLDPERILEVPALLQRELLRRCPPLWDGCAGERAAAAIERVAARAAHAPIPVIREPALCVA